ncbi:LytR/AlgR family response regulator transcription factor [Flavobacterium selenitireducens]|uniref:LytR/AlgR family response regulator transcription factor n=1 Tax=Flavobacterium selenitireducens TaxID=2722704 RepID=UPI00168AE708|nr:LytTR family DNA-binding domain-containing protein [Flavobacterium selenitireducens]MBD3582267.1 response regulator transcription factor [Flavobacterium selenitireducens]
MSAQRLCLIVDDEPAAHYVLANYIGQNPKLKLVHQCFNGFEAAEYLRENPVDLMFLDIDMPEMTGLELLKQLDNPPKTILTTAYSEFALESYDFGVIDYLLKPIYHPRFEKAIARLFDMYPKNDPVSDNRSHISVKVDSHFVDIAFDDFLYAQSYGNYVKIFTPQKTWLATITTNELEHNLPSDRFLRVHKSYIVSLGNIESRDRETVTIRGEKIPVGITYRRELSERLR